MSAALNVLHEITAAEDLEGDLGGDQANLSRQILATLRSSPGPLSARELRGSIDCSAESLSKRLYAMRMDGRVLGAAKHNEASPPISASENGGREKYEYSLPKLRDSGVIPGRAPAPLPGPRSLTTGEVSRRETSRKPKLSSRGVTIPGSKDGNAALQAGASSLEGVLLGMLPENFHEVLKAYGRLCGFVR